jgi:thiol-disulfide isomerase/thioredoxin
MQSFSDFDKKFAETISQIDQTQSEWQSRNITAIQAVNKIQSLHGRLILTANKRLRQLSNEAHISQRDEIVVSQISCLTTTLTQKVTEILHIIRNNTKFEADIVTSDVENLDRLQRELEFTPLQGGVAQSPNAKSKPATSGLETKPSKPPGDDFAELVVGNFDIKNFDESKPVFLNYWADWCGFSKRLMGYWPQVVKTLEQKYPDLQIISLNARTGSSVADQALEAGIESFPTMLLKVKGKTYELPGAKPHDEIVAFVGEHYSI